MSAAPQSRQLRQEVVEGLAVARTLRRELGLRDEEPVPCLVEVAEARLALDVVVLPLPEGVSGFYVPVPSTPIVFVSGGHTVSRQRFTLAHEIGHHALGHGASPRIHEAAGSPPAADGAAPDKTADGALPVPAADISSAIGTNSDAPAVVFEADAVMGPGELAPIAADAPAPAANPYAAHYKIQRHTDPNEIAANAFAAELLAPDAGASVVVASWRDQPPLDQAVRLSSHFGISALSAMVKLQTIGVLDRDGARALRKRLKTQEHVPRYAELDLPALDDELQRHSVSGTPYRCSSRARVIVRRLRAEADAVL